MIGKLLRSWPVIVTLLTIATVYGAVRATVEAHTASIRQIEIDVRENSVRIARLEQISLMIPEMREDIKTMLRYKSR